MPDIKPLLAGACQAQTLWRALRVSMLIGTLLTVINHYDDWAGGGTSNVNLFQIGLTYVIPFLVSTHGQLHGTGRQDRRT